MTNAAEERTAPPEAGAWDRLVHERVGAPLRPERLGSLLVIVPAASGDVALATTVIRHVKEANPRCRVAFATEKSNVALVRMCPGVDEVIELPPTPRRELSRRLFLERYAGAADAVVYTNWWPEDVDLAPAHGFSMLEAIWLLAGVPGGMPARPPRVWLESPLTTVEAAAVVARPLGRQSRRALALRCSRAVPESLAAMLRARSLQGSGFRDALRALARLGTVLEASRPGHRRRLDRGDLGGGFVMLSTEAASVPAAPAGAVRGVIRRLRRGRADGAAQRA